MSPEMFKKKPVSFATDVWSFGVIIFFLLTGRHPFEDEDQSFTSSESEESSE